MDEEKREEEEEEEDRDGLVYVRGKKEGKERRW